jgi:DNA adenine methylase
MASGDPAGRYPASLAAMLIFLNRTGFNGLFRVNSRGEFNVPAGRYANPKICDAPNILAWSAALGDSRVSLEVSPFDAALAHGRRGDFIYLDPPYAPLSGTARFTSYTAGGFDGVQQEALQRTVLGLAARGASVLLSNSVAPQIRLLYAGRGAARMAGFRATTVAARRAINSRAASRGPVREYLITNVPRCKLA